MPPSPPSQPSCPFCRIASKYPPIRPSSPNSSLLTRQDESGTGTDPETHLILSTKYVLAFLDIMPLTRGHVLVISREHHERLGGLGVKGGAEIGKWLPVISRAVMRTVLGKTYDNDGLNDTNAEDLGDWNVVQNNGARAAQLVPHIHFHVIPRRPSDSNPTAGKASWIMFGRGPRDELDDDEGRVLAKEMREELAREVERIRETEGFDLDIDLENVNSGKL